VRALLFDLDGTLVDSERQCAEAVARTLAKLGRRITEDERAFVVGHGWNEIHALLEASAPLGLTRDELILRAGAERERVVAEEGLLVLAGGVELVRAAHAAGLPVAIVSGSSRHEVADAVRALGIEHEVSFFVGAEDVRRGKPAPDGYLLAAAKLGVEPRDCVVLEDSAAGIAAALAAGMVVVATSAANFAGQAQEAAHRIVASLAEIELHHLSSLHERIHAPGRVAP
jgi:HAD superfamily hydrolase (TIGR01509 family)